MTIPNVCEGFKYGGNYAWNNFGLDIGGGQAGFAANSQTICADLQEMADHCVDIVRVWLYPDFRSPGLQFDANECVTGITGTTQADILAFSQCAANAGIKIMWNILAHNANDTDAEQGVARPKLRNSVINANCLDQFMTNLVNPIVSIIVNDANYANTFHSYDLFNEPEWMVDDANPVNVNQPFNEYHTAQMGSGNSVSYNQMYNFLDRMAQETRLVDPNACITIGSAGKKWGTAWEPIVDFNSPHSYNWDEAYFPSTSGPAAYNYTKPTMIGEFPPNGMAANANFIGQVPGALPINQTDLLCNWAENGYFSALAWSFGDNVFNWRGQNMDDGLAFQNAEVKRGRFIRTDPLTIECGETLNMTLMSVSNKNQHVPMDDSTLTVSDGTINSVTFNPNTCTYMMNITAPPCPANTNLVFTAEDENGNPMTGELPLFAQANCNLPTTSCQFLFGTCNNSTSSCDVEFGAINCNDPDNSCTYDIDCRCKPSIRQILGGDPNCPVMGETFEWIVSGCDCAGKCGPVIVDVKSGYNSSPTCYFSDEKIFRVGPVCDLNSIKFSVVCAKPNACDDYCDDVLINGGNDDNGDDGNNNGNNNDDNYDANVASCLNHNVFIGDVLVGETVSAADIATNAFSIDSIVNQTNSSVASLSSVNNLIVVVGKLSGTSVVTAKLKDVNGDCFNCTFTVFVNDPNLVCL